MISVLIRGVARLDLGFMLVRATLMVPILIAARYFDEAGLGEYSQMYHQLLIVSTVIVFGAHDRITVERRVDLRTERLGLSARLIVLVPLVFLYDDVILALVTLIFLHLTRSFPMVLLAAARSLGWAGAYAWLSVATVLSSVVLVVGYAFGWSVTKYTAISALVMAVAGLWVSRALQPEGQAQMSVRRVLTGWDYCLNFIFTSLFTQGVLFIASFVAGATEYAAVSRVMYLVQAGLIIQSVGYRMVLSLMVDGALRLRHAVVGNVSIACAWLVVMALGGADLEQALFGSRELTEVDYLLIGGLVILQSFNLALAPYLLAKQMVRRSLWVPATTLTVALCFAVTWNLIDSWYTIYGMVGAMAVSGLLTRVLIARGMETATHA